MAKALGEIERICKMLIYLLHLMSMTQKKCFNKILFQIMFNKFCLKPVVNSVSVAQSQVNKISV